MRVDGYWQVDRAGAVRPVLEVGMTDASGRLIEVVFLIDTGADRTVLDHQTLADLGAGIGTTGDYLHGIGGRIDAVSIDVPILLRRTDGHPVTIHGPFLASPDPAGLDQSVLGRDVLDHFALIIDRCGDVVTLLHAPHRYIIQDA